MADAAEQLAVDSVPRVIDWIDNRLVQWAEWIDANGSIVAGLGYGTCTLAGQAIRSTAGTGASAMPDGIYEIDRAVVQLPFELLQVVTEHYRHPDCPESKRVERCHCSRATYFRRLAKAHQCIVFLLPGNKPSRVRSGVAERMLKRMGR